MALYRDHVWHLTTQVCGVVPVQRTLIKMPHRDDWKRGCVNTGFFYSIHPISAADLKNFCNCLRFEFRVGDGEVVARFVPKAAAEVMDNPGGMYDTRRDEYMPEIILDVGTEFVLGQAAMMTVGLFAAVPEIAAVPEVIDLKKLCKVKPQQRPKTELDSVGMSPRLKGETSEAWAARNRPWTRAKCNTTGIQRCDDCLEWSCKLQDEEVFEVQRGGRFLDSDVEDDDDEGGRGPGHRKGPSPEELDQR